MRFLPRADSRSSVRATSWSLRPRLFSRERKRFLASCWVRVEAPRAAEPRAQSVARATGTSARSRPRWPKKPASSARRSALTKSGRTSPRGVEARPRGREVQAVGHDKRGGVGEPAGEAGLEGRGAEVLRPRGKAEARGREQPGQVHPLHAEIEAEPGVVRGPREDEGPRHSNPRRRHPPVARDLTRLPRAHAELSVDGPNVDGGDVVDQEAGQARDAQEVEADVHTLPLPEIGNDKPFGRLPEGGGDGAPAPRHFKDRRLHPGPEPPRQGRPAGADREPDSGNPARPEAEGPGHALRAQRPP